MTATASSRSVSASASASRRTASPRPTAGRGVRRVLYVIVLLAIAAIFITPYLFSVMAAFKPLSEIQGDRAWDLPSHFTLDNFVTIFTQYDFGGYLLNTAMVTIIITVGQVVFSLLGAYAFARIQFPGRDAIFWGYLSMLMVPNVVTMIPLYVMMSRVGLTDTYWALFLPYVFGTPYTIFLMRQYIQSIPSEVIEAARLDGCSELGVLRRVVVPISRPIIMTATIIAVIFSWNNFLWPLIATSSNGLQVLSVGVANFNSNFAAQWNLVLAGSLVALIPMVILFVLFQKHIVNSVNLSGASR
ncbi:carbohydrate ABC transporter permease [Frondihabitans australicus]|uniref:Carbohydrate ABC transporter membrane protein 2 (CUT1 family) n=1 Tax=Frondihabitans australicus TaxID=386892 RepID=A0A495IKL2_9MICO|nr:carbohydrate ABC transporter permease [Frondihabitans australicus]RKR76483.1 carbohydrate ABC transporter membrane protein 2 (CUT1 family) [Frondihabitans australicus]